MKCGAFGAKSIAALTAKRSAPRARRPWLNNSSGLHTEHPFCRLAHLVRFYYPAEPSLMNARLNVNIDHVATVRQARRAPEPSVVAAAMICEQAGADGITVHLRGDRRHIQDEDIYTLRRAVTTYLNVEMAATDEMIQIATDARPDAV